MNKTDKDQLEVYKQTLQELINNIEAMADAEQEKFDNLNEGMQAMERFQKLTENADTLYTAQEQLQEAFETLEELEQ